MRSKPRLSEKKNKLESYGPMVACACARGRARVRTPARLRVHAAITCNFQKQLIKTNMPGHSNK